MKSETKSRDSIQGNGYKDSLDLAKVAPAYVQAHHTPKIDDFGLKCAQWNEARWSGSGYH